MLISFFEEFPTKGNLEKLKLVSFPCKVYLASPSLEEFNKIKSSIKNKKVKEVVYWPILKKEEGYWISPFSKRAALLRIFNELKDENVPVMVDAELPTSRNPWLYLQSFNFFRNKSLIKNFIKDQKNVFTAEYYPQNRVGRFLLESLGLAFELDNLKVIKMAYHSMHSFNKLALEGKLKEERVRLKERLLLGLGTIAVGINGTEKLLSLEQLQKDLELAKDVGINEVVIFRLGGLNKGYVNVLKKFSK